jgi:hypothetical protein
VNENYVHEEVEEEYVEVDEDEEGEGMVEPWKLGPVGRQSTPQMRICCFARLG